MRRSILVLLLLANYLLVVGAGLLERPVQAIERPFAYVHRANCQLRHTLRLACFDDCNGVQYTVQKNGVRPPLHQLVAACKGLDVHCLPQASVGLATPALYAPAPRQIARGVAVRTGHRGELELPPRRG